MRYLEPSGQIFVDAPHKPPQAEVWTFHGPDVHGPPRLAASISTPSHVLMDDVPRSSSPATEYDSNGEESDELFSSKPELKSPLSKHKPNTQGTQISTPKSSTSRPPLLQKLTASKPTPSSQPVTSTLPSTSPTRPRPRPKPILPRQSRADAGATSSSNLPSQNELDERVRLAKAELSKTIRLEVEKDAAQSLSGKLPWVLDGPRSTKRSPDHSRTKKRALDTDISALTPTPSKKARVENGSSSKISLPLVRKSSTSTLAKALVSPSSTKSRLTTTPQKQPKTKPISPRNEATVSARPTRPKVSAVELIELSDDDIEISPIIKIQPVAPRKRSPLSDDEIEVGPITKSKPKARRPEASRRASLPSQRPQERSSKKASNLLDDDNDHTDDNSDRRLRRPVSDVRLSTSKKPIRTYSSSQKSVEKLHDNTTRSPKSLNSPTEDVRKRHSGATSSSVASSAKSASPTKASKTDKSLKTRLKEPMQANHRVDSAPVDSGKRNRIDSDSDNRPLLKKIRPNKSDRPRDPSGAKEDLFLPSSSASVSPFHDHSPPFLRAAEQSDDPSLFTPQPENHGQNLCDSPPKTPEPSRRHTDKVPHIDISTLRPVEKDWVLNKDLLSNSPGTRRVHEAVAKIERQSVSKQPDSGPSARRSVTIQLDDDPYPTPPTSEAAIESNAHGPYSNAASRPDRQPSDLDDVFLPGSDSDSLLSKTGPEATTIQQTSHSDTEAYLTSSESMPKQPVQIHPYALPSLTKRVLDRALSQLQKSRSSSIPTTVHTSSPKPLQDIPSQTLLSTPPPNIPDSRKDSLPTSSSFTSGSLSVKSPKRQITHRRVMTASKALVQALSMKASSVDELPKSMAIATPNPAEPQNAVSNVRIDDQSPTEEELDNMQLMYPE
ncbi:hypothetical protein VKT23_006922 [Stygiomarasmius scandens]|uniref:Uncharacterized protein n=1 Tax=Marasmiellus scandens TaxID=2682957 RepID=A0ABR1JLU9_9AGAR